MKNKLFEIASTHVEDPPLRPPPTPTGNDVQLIERLRHAGIGLADSVLVHERQCRSKAGGLCDCDVVIFCTYYAGRKRRRACMRLRD